MPIERVCVVGAGVIGSLYAGHLASLCDVSVLTRRPEHAQALNDGGLRISGKSDLTARVFATADPADLHDFDLGIVATKATQLEDAAAALAGPRAGRDDDDDPERPRGRGAPAREGRLAADLRRDLHERRSPLRHARRVRARHRDVARALRRDDDLRASAGDRAAPRRRRPACPRIPRPSPGPVVEADLQRDRQHHRRADEPAARLRVRRGRRADRPRASSSAT